MASLLCRWDGPICTRLESMAHGCVSLQRYHSKEPMSHRTPIDAFRATGSPASSLCDLVSRWHPRCRSVCEFGPGPKLYEGSPVTGSWTFYERHFLSEVPNGPNLLPLTKLAAGASASRWRSCNGSSGSSGLYEMRRW